MSMYASFFFFSSRRRHTRLQGDWSSDVCSSDLGVYSWARQHPTNCSPRNQGQTRPKLECRARVLRGLDRKSTRLNSSHLVISYAVFCLKKKKNMPTQIRLPRK